MFTWRNTTNPHSTHNATPLSPNGVLFFIDNKLTVLQHNVLIHCYLGCLRLVAVIVAYFCRSRNITISEVLQLKCISTLLQLKSTPTLPPPKMIEKSISILKNFFFMPLHWVWLGFFDNIPVVVTGMLSKKLSQCRGIKKKKSCHSLRIELVIQGSRVYRF
jgi:hypothetical protein